MSSAIVILQDFMIFPWVLYLCPTIPSVTSSQVKEMLNCDYRIQLQEYSRIAEKVCTV